MSNRTCVFFGHREIRESITEILCQTLTDLILKHGVTRFLVGNQGAFDRTVLSVLRLLRQHHISGAAKYTEIAQRKGLTIINLAEKR